MTPNEELKALIARFEAETGVINPENDHLHGRPRDSARARVLRYSLMARNTEWLTWLAQEKAAGRATPDPT